MNLLDPQSYMETFSINLRHFMSETVVWTYPAPMKVH